MNPMFDDRSQCLLLSSQNPSCLTSIIAVLRASGIETEEALHRPWGSDNFAPALMVCIQDYTRAFSLAKPIVTAYAVMVH